MKNFKTIMIIGVLLLCAAVVGISYALVSSSFDIKGKARMGSGSWDVHFENLSNSIINGTAEELKRPYIADKSTSIVDIYAKLQQPSDAIYYLFDVVNKGGLDAQVSSIQVSQPNCIGKGSNAMDDALLVCHNIKFELTYADGTTIYKTDTLRIGERKKLKLKLSYNGTQLPINEVEISNLSIALVYSQR